MQGKLNKEKGFPPFKLLLYLFWFYFKNLTVELHVLIKTSMIAKFQEDQKSIAMSSIKYLNFKFLWYKIMNKK